MKTIILKQLIVILACISSCYSTFAQSSEDSVKWKNQTAANVSQPKILEPDIRCFTAPEGFIISEAYNGYVHFQTSTTVLIQRYENVNLFQLRDAMTEEFYQKNNLRFISQEDFKTEDGTNGIMYRCEFELKDTKFVRYMVYIGDLNHTLWINITYPDVVEALVKEPLLNSIYTTTFKAVAHED